MEKSAGKGMVLVDCTRLKYPNRGMYTYTFGLVRALIPEAKRRGISLGLYVPEKWVGAFGDDIYYQVCKHRHQLFFPIDRRVRVFHSASQRSMYVPRHNSRIKVLTTIHDVAYPYLKTRPLRDVRVKLQYQLSADVSDRIVTISDYSRNDILKYLKVKGKTVDVVYNGCESYTGPEVAPAQVPDRDFLYCICRIAPAKNLFTLPPLLVGNDMLLILSGSEQDHGIQQVMDAAERCGVADRIIFTGAVDEAVKHWYIEHCKAFVFPSLMEGFGLPIIEAMQHGKPVFLSDRCCLPEIAGGCGFTFDHDFEPEQMRKIFEEGMEAYEHGQPSSEAIRQHGLSFSWEKAASQYCDIYEQML